jgi:hypothetical protein
MAELVFGYASLVGRLGSTPGRQPDPRGYVCDLAGFRRRWGVAMDNAEVVPGYKVHLDPVDGTWPEVMVAFLDLYSAEDDSVNGFLFPVDAGDLAALDERERNYERIDVTQAIRPAPSGRVWTYMGHRDAHARFERGLADGQLVISREDLRETESSFAALGSEEVRRFEESTDAPPCPVWELERVDLPAAVGDRATGY